MPLDRAIRVLVVLAAGLAVPAPFASAGEKTGGEQASQAVRIGDARMVTEPGIAFLAREPVVDGRLDAEIENLPRRSFAFLLDESHANPDIHAEYRLAYGTEFLYVYIEYTADAIVSRDRGYQNGDGFVVVLERLGSDGKAADSYMLAYHPAPGTRRPFRQMIWQRDDAWPFSRLGEHSRFAAATHGGRVGFEALLRWEEVPPLHPWLDPQLAFNLVLSKAAGTTDVAYFTAAPFDETGSGHVSLSFDPPALAEGVQSYVLLERNHVTAGAPVAARVASMATAAGRERIAFWLESGEGGALAAQSVTFELPAGISVRHQALELGDPVPGGYTVRWEALDGAGAGRAGLSVLPRFDVPSRLAQLETARPRVGEGTYQTLRFTLEDVGRRLAALKDAETCAELRADMQRYLDLTEAAAAGRDPLVERTGLSRRAFVSRVDGARQPYTLYVPAKLEPGRKYAAMVFLHGSDTDDRSIEDAMRTAPVYFPPDVFVIAPNGRGPRTDYGESFAQDDIREAVADATRWYPIDPRRLVLAGFSMGGYGVLRTLWENPGKYAGAVVLSGSPDARSGGSQGQPDFREAKNQQSLRHENILVLHGGRDRNCPVEIMVDLVGKLKAAGVSVRMLLDEDAGHELSRDPKIIEAYLEWLRAAAAEKRGQ